MGILAPYEAQELVPATDDDIPQSQISGVH